MFEKSAEQAGYFEHGKTRLVMPAVTARDDLPPPPPPPDENTNRDRKGNGGGGDMGDHDPLTLLWHFRLGDICKEHVTVRTLSGWRSCEEVEDRLPDGRHTWLWWRS